MSGADRVTLVAGLVIAAAYFAAAAVKASTSKRVGSTVEPRTSLQVAITEAAIVVLCSGLALIVIDAVAPGSNAFRNSSAVGFLSPKVLPVWDAVSLWAGLAAVLGTIVPFFDGFRKQSSGIPGTVALLAIHNPIVLLLAVGTWATAIQFLPSERARLPLALFVAATTEWVLSMTGLRPLWGIVHGPESTLWILALGGVLLARWSHDGVSNRVG